MENLWYTDDRREWYEDSVLWLQWKDALKEEAQCLGNVKVP